MKKPMNRRMFLRGAGGAVMAIPFLPSVLSKAFAADPKLGPSPRFFLAFGTDHGDVWGKNMYPSDALLTQTMNYAGRDVRYGKLPSTPDNKGQVVWSPMYQASAGVLTPALAAKFNILRAIDIPYTVGHSLAAQLGHTAEAHHFKYVAGTSSASNAYRTATIDQLMAWSPSFYTEEDLNAKMTQRSFCVWNGELSWNFSSPSTKTGNVVQQSGIRNNKVLFDYFFKPGSAYHNVDTVIIDRVKGSYDRLKKDPRLSKGDLERLNQHVERMAEIERKLAVIEKIGAPPIEKPTKDSDYAFGDSAYLWNTANNAKYCELMNDIIVAAFSSGVSRVGTWKQGMKFNNTQINAWHGQVAHSGLGTEVAQTFTLAWNRGTFEHGMVGLAAKLDAELAADGSTLLDNSLLMQTSEAGQITHHPGCVNFPIAMAGGAGGYFKTGMFVDFGNTNKVYDDFNAILAEKPGLIPESPGLYYNQFLANALMSMGVPASEWETFTEFTTDGPSKSTPTKGYGFHYVDPKRAKDYEQAKLVMGDKLPVITS